MRIYQEVPLPPTCYVAEAALWIAVGRVPKVLFKASDYGNDYSESDPRTNREALDEDAEILPFDAGFSEAELRQLGVGEIDFDLYRRTKQLLAVAFPYLRNPSGKEAVDAELQQQQIFDELAPGKRRKPDDRDMEALYQGVNWAQAVDAQCNAMIDIARAEFYRALATGKILAQGWRNEPELAGKSQEPLVSIPASHWSLRDFDWEESVLRHSTGSYYAVQVPTSEMLRVFPKPHAEAASKVVESFPGCILVEEEEMVLNPSAPSRVQRGRREKGGGFIKLVVVNVFTDRARRNELPTKAEALVQEIIDYVALAFEQTISRSTAQQYIKLLPEIDARK